MYHLLFSYFKVLLVSWTASAGVLASGFYADSLSVFPCLLQYQLFYNGPAILRGSGEVRGVGVFAGWGFFDLVPFPA